MRHGSLSLALVILANHVGWVPHTRTRTVALPENADGAAISSHRIV